MAWRNGFWILVYCFVYFQRTTSKTVSLSVDKTFPVVEGERIGFTCVITGNTIPRSVHFESSFLDGDIASWITQNNICEIFQSPNMTLFDASCDMSSLTFSMTILRASSSYHQNNVTCEATFNGTDTDFTEGFITVEVNVPLVAVEMETKENITLQENDEVNVTCSARSRPVPHFTWFVSGRQIHDNYTITTFDETGPSGTSTLTYTGNRTDNTERLYCVAKSGEKQQESSGNFLSITYPPDIDVHPNGIPIEGIQQYNISCLILDSNPSVNTFRWYINSELVSEQTSNILTIDYLNRTDTNNYTCNATNGIGDPTTDFVFLDVLYKGSILMFNTTNTSMTEGHTYTAYVDVEGKPLPNVTWTRERTDAILLTENDVTNSSLNMTSMCEDTGNYTASVDNGLVQPDRRHFRLNVFCSPRKDQYTNSPDDISIQAGGMLTLETKIVAFPQPDITWYFRSNSSQTNVIISDNNFQISKISNDAIHLLTLTIEKTNSSHSGQYTVIILNSMGQHNTSFSVNIIEPHSESSVKVEAIVAGVIGAVVFIILAACVVNCYRKKKKKEKQRKRSWRSSSKDIDDIIKENPIEDFGPIEPAYTSNAMYYNCQPSIQSIETGENTNKIYAEVVKQTTRQQPEVVIADSDANTKL